MMIGPGPPESRSLPGVPMIAVIAADAALALPARSVAFAVSAWVPAARTRGMDQVPAALAAPARSGVTPSNRAIAEFASAVPEIAAGGHLADARGERGGGVDGDRQSG